MLKSAATSGKVSTVDHNYSQMDVTASSGIKRKGAPATPTRISAPPSKVKTSLEMSETPNTCIVEAIEKLTSKIDSFGDQLRENSVMVANITRLVELNATEIKECKVKIQVFRKRNASSRKGK